MQGEISDGPRDFSDVRLSPSVQDVLGHSFKAYPDSIAVVDSEVCLSYSDLAGLSASVAEGIVAKTRTAPACIALAFDQGACFIVALTAVLRAGCTYVPLDPRRGKHWNAEIVTRTRCSLILCTEAYADFASGLGAAAEVIRIPEFTPADSGLCISRPPDDIACIYCTSGTTGPPKAVCDTHRNLLHNSWRYAHSLKTTAADHLSLIQAPIFSGTQSTIFMGLTRGCTLCCYDLANGRLGHLPDWLLDNRVTMFHAVPSIFRLLAVGRYRYDDIRLVRIEGDRATSEDVRVLRAHFSDDCMMVVGLGATECGLVRQYFITRDTLIKDGILPVGGPVRDMEVSIRDEGGATCGPGEIGEVWVTSKYLAPGYLGDEARTRAKFRSADDCWRSYRTGDIGHLDEDGLLWLRGRDDRQVKIRGESVDLNEIEQALTGLPFVGQALVDARSDDRGRTSIVAYLTSSVRQPPGLEAVRGAIAEKLPAHLQPARLVWLEQLPVTIDGKVDRAALPSLTRNRPEMEIRYVAPRDEIERALVDIWQDLLDMTPVGVLDDVFALGCDSLVVVRFVQRVKSGLGIDIEVSGVFKGPTVAAMATMIAQRPDRVS